LHRRKVKRDAEEVVPPPARDSSAKARSHAAHLRPGSPGQEEHSRPEGGPDTGNDPGALLKR
jgi:hypothetical protein